MISCIISLPRGVCASKPVRFEPSPAELEALEAHKIVSASEIKKQTGES